MPVIERLAPRRLRRLRLALTADRRQYRSCRRTEEDNSTTPRPSPHSGQICKPYAARSSSAHRIFTRLSSPVAGALGGQITLALSSLVLQVLAARELGVAGLGSFALLLGAMVMATALSTGLIGDSLTVLDRRDPAIRAALGWGTLGLVAILAVVGVAVTAIRLPWSTAMIFGLALALYVAADLARRLLMANLRFWNLVLIDGTGFAVVLCFIGACALHGPLHLNHFLAAVALGQFVACAVALSQVPTADRGRMRRVTPAWRAVLSFGVWRALQQFVRPAMMNGARGMVLLAGGAAAVGQLEAARVFVAPSMLLVQGFGSYLFSSYAADRTQSLQTLRRRADRAAFAMLLGSMIVGCIAALLLPHLGHLLTAGRFELSLLSALGWACYAASCAAVLPFGSLAAVAGKQHWVLVVRLLDSLLSLGLVALAVLIVGFSTTCAPWLLSAGSFVGGLVCRQFLLRPGSGQLVAR